MTEKQIAAREKELQRYFRMHPRLNLEYKAMMSRLLREHRIDVTPETLARMTVALDRSGATVDAEEIPISLPPPLDKQPAEVSEPSQREEPTPETGNAEDEEEAGSDEEPGSYDEPEERNN